jgi:glycosyltransferase involved in cell wall biosynthesis
VRILCIANVTPWPPRSGITLRILRLLERVGAVHEVTLGCHTWDAADREAVETLTRRGIRTVGGAVRPASLRSHAWKGIRAGLRGVPPETAQYQAPELHALIQAGDFDLLHIEESILAPYAQSMPTDRRIPRLLTLHNVHFVQEERLARIEPTLSGRARRRFNGAWMRAYEPRMAASFDRVIAVTEDDRRALLACAPDLRIDVVPNGVDTKAIQPLPMHDGPPALLFVGSMFYRPCVDAAVWLVREILPLLRRTHPALEVWLVGKGPTAEVRALAGPGVHVVGEVEDLAPYYARATLALAPLRAGGGSRLKILEAMAFGRAVVSTTIGAEGLDLTDGTDVAIADDAEAFAARVDTLLGNATMRDAMVRAARAQVEQRYDWDDLGARLLAIYAECAPGTRERARV